jgi:hypothetical protein
MKKMFEGETGVILWLTICAVLAVIVVSWWQP